MLLSVPVSAKSAIGLTLFCGAILSIPQIQTTVQDLALGNMMESAAAASSAVRFTTLAVASTWEETAFSKSLSAIFMVVYFVFGVITIPAFFRRRETCPIKQRRPDLVIYGAICGILFGILSSMTVFASSFENYLPCFAMNIASGVFLGLFIDSLLVRSYLLFFAFNLVQERIKMRLRFLRGRKRAKSKNDIVKSRKRSAISTEPTLSATKSATSSTEAEIKPLYPGLTISSPDDKREPLSSSSPTLGKSPGLTPLQIEDEEHGLLLPSGSPSPDKSRSVPLSPSASAGPDSPPMPTGIELAPRTKSDGDSLVDNAKSVSDSSERGTKISSGREGSWFSRNKRILSASFENYCFFFLLTLHLVLTFALGFSVDEGVIGDRANECLNGKTPTMTAAILSIQVILYAFFAFRLRVVEDGYDIKKELMSAGKCGLLTAFVWNFIRFVGPKFIPVHVTVPLALFILYGGILSMLWAVLIPPLLKSYQLEKEMKHIDGSGNMELLENLITTKEGFHAFKQFLEKELSVENIFFWEAIHNYKNNFRSSSGTPSSPRPAPAASYSERSSCESDSSNEMIQEAKRIFEVFLKAGSHMEVNISYKLLQKFRSGPLNVDAPENADPEEYFSRLREEVTPNYFDEAQREVFMLMKTDSYRRFVRTPMFKELISKNQRLRQEDEVLRQIA